MGSKYLVKRTMCEVKLLIRIFVAEIDYTDGLAVVICCFIW